MVQAYLLAAGLIPNPVTGKVAPMSGIYNVDIGSRLSINELAQQTVAEAGAQPPTPRACTRRQA
ncbi:hypothetical protein DSM19430T_00060 [Desulfovibrio psychrotolerans]|uniref:Uncharacterized protein n=1 Tax=Desulfovibrio psychrotolerans TaxID=415242 RepID=A0A7J0BQ62_9BACT|nr:hypothetical protein DSM19430T_00060 [Desulfovibrio psychrotolerans]